MGDSYASGTGAGSYGDRACQRSSNAYPALYGTGFPSFRFVACTGASTQSLKRQFAALTPATTLVTITIGGNDLGFVDVMTTCTLSGDRACAARVAKSVKFAGEQLPARLDATYARIKELAPHASLVVLGYPRLFTPADRCSTLSRSKRQVLNDAADQLSDVIAAAASKAGARYVDVREAFAAHGVCSAQPWINGLVSPTGDSYHPNKAGHAAYVEALTASW